MSLSYPLLITSHAFFLSSCFVLSVFSHTIRQLLSSISIIMNNLSSLFVSPALKCDAASIFPSTKHLFSLGTD